MKATALFALLALLPASAPASRLLEPLALAAGADPRGLLCADFNADGYADAVAADFGSPALVGQACSSPRGSLKLFLGSARGLQSPQALALEGEAPRGLAAADIDGDGHPDLLASCYGSGRLACLLWRGAGFSAPLFAPVGSQPLGVAAASFRGSLWVAVADYGSGQVSLLKASSGSLEPLATLGGFQKPVDVKLQAAGGRLALLVSDAGAGLLARILLGEDGSAAARQDLAAPGMPGQLALGDLDGDGLAEAAVARFADSAVSVFPGLPGGELSGRSVSLPLRGSHPNGLALGRLGASAALAVAERDSDQVELLRYAAGALSSTALLKAADPAGSRGAYGPVEAALADVDGDGLGDLLATHKRASRLLLWRAAPAAAPQLSSPSHPDPQAWSPASELIARWTQPPDLDGVARWRVRLDQQPAGQPGPADAELASPEFRAAGLATGVHYLHVRAVDAGGRDGELATYRVAVTSAMSRDNVYNYPNPTRDGRTTIRFPLLEPAAVELRIYDGLGSLAWSRDLSPAETAAGVNALEWDGRNGRGQAVANGGYVLTVRSGSALVTKKIAVVR